MKKLSLLIAFFLCLPVFAQTKLPETFEIDIDTVQEYIDIPEENFHLLRSGKEHLTFKQVLQPQYQAEFKEPITKITSLDLVQYQWVRYKLKNTSAEKMRFTFSADNDRHNFYIYLGSNKWVHYTTGKLVPWSERNGMKEICEIPYTLNPGQEILVYADLGNTGAISNNNPTLGNYNTTVEKYYAQRRNYTNEDVVSFGFLGFMLFGMIFNLFFYQVNRERVYLVFSLMLFFSSLLISESAWRSLAFSEYPGGYTYFLAFAVTGFIVMLMHTTRFFFRINVLFPGWDKFLVYSSIFTAISGVLICIGVTNKWYMFSVITVGILSLCAVSFVVAAIIMIIMLLKKKDKQARLFVVAALPFILSPLLALLLQMSWVIATCGLWTILVLSWGMFARFKSLQIENARAALEKEEQRTRIIAEQNELLEKQVAERTSELQHSLESLKQTQNQLIQSEKMASLGELTAGIAHEIQNPLNFVNNFSDVSIELLDEMEEELDKGDTDEVKAIAGDIKQNLEKIAHHGRRADSIVKGMLQHSRASTGQKEPTDINALADEYFRLAYHGLRAKDKSFNADLVTHFAEGLPKVSLLPQDMGRVLLNLFTNAFYATQQKAKQLQGAGFKPAVEVGTKLIGNKLEIEVKDNGTGIPDAVKDKILQPFFTTKPTGEGTGLGLSLSYDIVVKAHGGTIDIESTEGEGSRFIITLPLSN